MAARMRMTGIMPTNCIMSIWHCVRGRGVLERGSSRAERPGRRAFVERFSPIRPPPRNVHVAAAAVPRPSTDYPRGTRGGAATLRGALSILRGVVGRRLPRGRDAIAPRPRSAGTTGDPGPRRGVADCPGGRFEPPDTVRRRWAQFPPRRRRGRSQRSPTPPSGARRRRRARRPLALLPLATPELRR